MSRMVTAAAIVCAALLFSSAPAGAARGQNAQARVLLDRELPAINFAGVSLRDALDFLRDVSGANMHVNWKAI